MAKILIRFNEISYLCRLINRLDTNCATKNEIVTFVSSKAFRNRVCIHTPNLKMLVELIIRNLFKKINRILRI